LRSGQQIAQISNVQFVKIILRVHEY